MPYINQITTVLPPNAHQQSAILDYMLEVYPTPDEHLGKIKALYSRCGIDTRYSVLNDFNVAVSERTLYKQSAPLMQHRMAAYMETALPLCTKAVNELEFKQSEITHLITVSCTGMSAPGLDVLLMQALELPANIARTSVNFMGCYAAVHALKMAHAFCATAAEVKVLIVLVEACTLHFQYEYSLENVATSMLFADGAAALLVSNNASEKSLQLNSFYSEVQNSSLQDMTWNLSDVGFKMTLSAYVPDILAANIEGLLHRALQNKKAVSDIKHWAIHPGGKKIVEEIRKALQLSPEDVHDSLEVLRLHGNMSSVTLAFVLLLKMNKAQSGEDIFACAFGPGLTMETILLSK
jgi:predicted naringenin-chalcone synthase